MTLMTYTGTLTIIDCARCHMDFGVIPNFDRARRDDHARFYCPSGHVNHYPQDSEAEKLKRQLANESARATRLLAQLDGARTQRAAAERRVSAMKGVVTKTKKRIAAGKCVRCTCEFPDLAAHMAEAHPDYAPEAE